MRTTRRPVVAVLGASLLLLASACGSDDDTTSTAAPTTAAAASTSVAATTIAAAPTTAATTTDAATTTARASTTTAPASTTAQAATTTVGALTTATAGEFAAEPYCAAEMAVEAAGNPEGDPSEDPKGYATALLAVAKQAAALAPASLADDFASAISVVEGVAASGDLSPMDDLDTHAIHDFDLDTCGWNRSDVTAQDYHFEGLPTTLPAGVQDVEFTNAGTEFHVLVIVKKKAGVTESFEELLADPDAESKVDTVGSTAAAPGQPGAYGVFDLEPGEYLALCPIPQGTEGDAEGTGPPHFTLGMSQVITVT